MNINYISIFHNNYANPKKMTIKNSLLNIALAITLLIGLGGFFLMDTDLWDGIIVAHAIAVGRPDVYHEWFSEAGLFFTPYIYDVVYLARSLVGYELLAKFFSISFLILASIEVGKLVTRYFKVPPNIVFFTAFLFFLSPAWVLYYSNIYLMHSFSLFVTLIATRYILDRKALFLALPALLLSFQQSSNAPLSISLILLSCVYIHTQRRERIINAAIILFIIIGFFALRKLFPTFGLYATYNKIELYNLISIKMYARYFIYFALLYFPLFCFMLITLWHSKTTHLIKLFSVIISGIMLNGVAYIAVGKLPSFYEIGLIHAESLRFTFTSTVFAVLLLPSIWQGLAGHPRTREIFLLLVMICACSINLLAHEGKMKEVIFQRGMIHELKTMPELPACIVNIKSVGVGALTNYEYGNMFYKAYGRVILFPLSDSSEPYSDTIQQYELLKKESYRHKYIVPQQQPTCLVNLHIFTELNKLSLLNTLYIYFTFKEDSVVNLNVALDNQHR